MVKDYLKRVDEI